jgi:hypothetical protein
MLVTVARRCSAQLVFIISFDVLLETESRDLSMNRRLLTAQSYMCKRPVLCIHSADKSTHNSHHYYYCCDTHALS